jgi:tRNA threonylcarbamoyladenosine biosynthesis protein TsaE
VDTVELTSKSAQQTERLAAALAAGLLPGDLVLVAGEVGAGKTTFVRGACRALGVRENVTSPSFTIGRTYSGRFPVSHIDLFRLDTLEGEDPTLLADYLVPGSVAFVEWPAAAAQELEPERVALRVHISHAGGDRRHLRVAGQPVLLGRLPEAVDRPG